MRLDRERLRDILEAIEAIERYTSAGREEFDRNELVNASTCSRSIWRVCSGNWIVPESAVLAYASVHPGTIAIIDDGAGRRCAETFGISLNGTLGLVITAKIRGFIPAARPVVETLKQHGMYLSSPVIDRALALIRE